MEESGEMQMGELVTSLFVRGIWTCVCQGLEFAVLMIDDADQQEPRMKAGEWVLEGRREKV